MNIARVTRQKSKGNLDFKPVFDGEVKNFQVLAVSLVKNTNPCLHV